MRKANGIRMPKGHLMSYRTTDKTRALSLRLLKTLKGEVPTAAFNALAACRDAELVELEVNPSSFDNASSFADAYQAVSLLSKSPSLRLGLDTAEEAMKKFFVAEDTCASTNNRFRKLREGPGSYFEQGSPESFISTARRKIARLLGPLQWDEVEERMEFGPGATYGLPNRKGDAYYKYGCKPEVTSGCAILAAVCVSRIPRWWQHVTDAAGFSGWTLSEVLDSSVLPAPLGQIFAIQPGNRITTVPKNAKTDRTIAIEPLLNGYIQRGLGNVIRHRLKRVGVDLDDQTTNQVFAKLGSIDGSYATIDLKAASDSVSYGLLDLLLPDDWAIALKTCRSPNGVLPDGTVIRYQKVSSMGNGFTFELESLIFWAIIRTLPFGDDHRVCVYGDDLIVPSAVAGCLIERLEYLGFSTNLSKTFVSGPFRESCGKHYFHGIDVTPIYIREVIDSPARLFWFCNQVRRYSRLSWGLDGRFKDVYDLGVKYLPVDLRNPTIPDGVGDGALFGDFDETAPRKCYGKFKSCEGYEARFHVEVASQHAVGGLPYLLRALAKSTSEQPLVKLLANNEVGKGKTKQRKIVLSRQFGCVPTQSAEKDSWITVRCPIGRWESFGPWLA